MDSHKLLFHKIGGVAENLGLHVSFILKIQFEKKRIMNFVATYRLESDNSYVLS